MTCVHDYEVQVNGGLIAEIRGDPGLTWETNFYIQGEKFSHFGAEFPSICGRFIFGPTLGESLSKILTQLIKRYMTLDYNTQVFERLRSISKTSSIAYCIYTN